MGIRLGPVLLSSVQCPTAGNLGGFLVAFLVLPPRDGCGLVDLSECGLGRCSFTGWCVRAFQVKIGQRSSVESVLELAEGGLVFLHQLLHAFFVQLVFRSWLGVQISQIVVN